MVCVRLRYSSYEIARYGLIAIARTKHSVLTGRMHFLPFGKVDIARLATTLCYQDTAKLPSSKLEKISSD